MSVATTQRTAAAPPPPPAGAPRGARTGWLALGALVVVAFALLLHLGRQTGFYYDEWDWVTQRRAWTLDTLLRPHNDHLSLFPLLVFKTLFSTVGLGSYVPYRIVGLLVHCTVAVLLYVYARRRVGEVLALAAAAVLLLLGSAWQDVLWPFQIGFLGSLAFGLGALLAVDRGDRRGEIAASALLVLSLSSSSLGIAVFAAAAIEVLGRPDRRARWWILVAPLVLYGIWWLHYGRAGVATVDNLFAAPQYVAEAAAGAAGGLFALGRDWGRTIVVALLALLVVAVHRRGGSWRLTALLAAPLAFWTLTALARANLGDPASPRYIYPGAVFLLLLAAEAGAGLRLPGRPLAVAGAVVLGAVLLGNVGALRGGGGFLRDQTTSVDGTLAALPLVASRVGPDFQPATPFAPQIRAGLYLDAARTLGSPAPPPSALPRLYESAREAADESLRRALTPRLVPDKARPRGPAPKVAALTAARTTTSGSCQSFSSTGGAASADVVVPRGGVLLRPVAGGFAVTVRRFADAYGGQGIGSVPLGSPPVLLAFPPDASPVPWTARLTFGGAVRACAVG